MRFEILTQGKIYWLVVVVILALTTWLRVRVAGDYNFAVTYDQGRDLLEVRSIVIGHRPALVGPNNSINGVFLGPFWYYWNVIPFLLGGGDPTALLYWQIGGYQLAGLGIAWYYRHRDRALGGLASGLWLLMPIGFYVNRFIWNVHPMPTMVVFWLLTLLWVMEKQTRTRLLVLGIVNGLGLQIEAALGILLLPTTLSVLSPFFAKERSASWRRGELKQQIFKISYLLWGLGLTLLPQFLYELRHQFSMSRLLWQQFSGQASILGESLSLSAKLADRYENFLRLVHDTSHLPPDITLGLFVILIGWLVVGRRRWMRDLESVKLFRVSATLLILAAGFYLIFPQKLKHWYIDGLAVPVVLLTALGWRWLMGKPNIGTVRGSLTMIGMGCLLWTVGLTWREQTDYINRSKMIYSADKSNLANEMQVVDWVYQQAADRGFWVYNYLPSVYDYPYQYVFWWYGTRKYGYQPAKITYADNVPEYIKSNDRARNQVKSIEGDGPIFLIIEPDEEFPDRREGWLKNFSSLCLQEATEFGWGTKVEVREKCRS